MAVNGICHSCSAGRMIRQNTAQNRLTRRALRRGHYIGQLSVFVVLDLDL